jgi:transcriptional regulator with XRE-family HTH domain
MSTLAERVRYVREHVLGLTQERFALKLKVTRGAVSNWEHGADEGIAPKNLQAIAALAQVSLDWLMNDTGGPPPPKPLSGKEIIAELLASIGESRLRALRELPASDFAAAVAEALLRRQSAARLERHKNLEKSSPPIDLAKSRKLHRPKKS